LHAAALARPQQIRPRLRRLAEPVGESNELLGPVRADTENDEQADLVLLEPDLQADPVDPHVDVIGVLQRSGVGGALLVLPLLGETRDDRGRQARTGAEELRERWPEVAARQAVQVQQRQHLRDLRGLPRPRGQDRRTEPDPLHSHLIRALVVDPRRLDRNRTRGGHHLPRLVRAGADHQPPTLAVEQLSVRVEVRRDLGLQRRREHLPGTLTDQRVEQLRTRCIGLVIGLAGLPDYLEHGRNFPNQRANAGPDQSCLDFGSSSGKRAPSRHPPRLIHRF
jgi:hypothetical protein